MSQMGDFTLIRDEDQLRKMWIEAEDFGKKKEIRAHMYKLREERLRDLYKEAQEEYSISKGEEFTSHEHGKLFENQSFQSIKSKEVRDAGSPPHEYVIKIQDMKNNPDAGWTVESTNEIVNDGHTQIKSKNAHIAGKIDTEHGVGQFSALEKQKHQVTDYSNDGFSLHEDIQDEHASSHEEFEERSVHGTTKQSSNSTEKSFFKSTTEKTTTDDHDYNIEMLSPKQNNSRNVEPDHAVSSRDDTFSKTEELLMDEKQFLSGKLISRKIEYPDQNTKVVVEQRALSDGTIITSTKTEMKQPVQEEQLYMQKHSSSESNHSERRKSEKYHSEFESTNVSNEFYNQTLDQSTNEIPEKITNESSKTEENTINEKSLRSEKQQKTSEINKNVSKVYINDLTHREKEKLLSCKVEHPDKDTTNITETKTLADGTTVTSFKSDTVKPNYTKSHFEEHLIKTKSENHENNTDQDSDYTFVEKKDVHSDVKEKTLFNNTVKEKITEEQVEKKESNKKEDTLESSNTSEYTSTRISKELSPSHRAWASTLRSDSPTNTKPNRSHVTSTNSVRSSTSNDRYSSRNTKSPTKFTNENKPRESSDKKSPDRKPFRATPSREYIKEISTTDRFDNKEKKKIQDGYEGDNIKQKFQTNPRSDNIPCFSDSPRSNTPQSRRSESPMKPNRSPVRDFLNYEKLREETNRINTKTSRNRNLVTPTTSPTRRPKSNKDINSSTQTSPSTSFLNITSHTEINMSEQKRPSELNLDASPTPVINDFSPTHTYPRKSSLKKPISLSSLESPEDRSNTSPSLTPEDESAPHHTVVKKDYPDLPLGEKKKPPLKRTETFEDRCKKLLGIDKTAVEENDEVFKKDIQSVIVTETKEIPEDIQAGKFKKVEDIRINVTIDKNKPIKTPEIFEEKTKTTIETADYLNKHKNISSSKSDQFQVEEIESTADSARKISKSTPEKHTVSPIKKPTRENVAPKTGKPLEKEKNSTLTREISSKKIESHSNKYSKTTPREESTKHKSSSLPQRSEELNHPSKNKNIDRPIIKPQKDNKYTRSLSGSSGTSSKSPSSPTKAINKPLFKVSKEVNEKNKLNTAKNLVMKQKSDSTLNMPFEDDDDIIIDDVEHAKSSRENSPDRICPTPVKFDEFEDRPRLPDEVSEPDDERIHRKHEIILEDETFDFEEDIVEMSEDEEILKNSNIDKITDSDECLLSVTAKVTKFTSAAEAKGKSVKKSSQFHEIEKELHSDIAQVEDKRNSLFKKNEKNGLTVTKPDALPFGEKNINKKAPQTKTLHVDSTDNKVYVQNEPVDKNVKVDKISKTESYNKETESWHAKTKDAVNINIKDIEKHDTPKTTSLHSFDTVKRAKQIFENIASNEKTDHKATTKLTDIGVYHNSTKMVPKHGLHLSVNRYDNPIEKDVKPNKNESKTPVSLQSLSQTEVTMINQPKHHETTNFIEKEVEFNTRSGSGPFSVDLRRTSPVNVPDMKKNIPQSCVEDIYELAKLEEMLETTVGYEQRRRIRAQIRLVKTKIDSAKVNSNIKSTTRTEKPTGSFISKAEKIKIEKSSDNLKKEVTKNKSATNNEPKLKSDTPKRNVSPQRRVSSEKITIRSNVEIRRESSEKLSPKEKSPVRRPTERQHPISTSKPAQPHDKSNKFNDYASAYMKKVGLETKESTRTESRTSNSNTPNPTRGTERTNSPTKRSTTPISATTNSLKSRSPSPKKVKEISSTQTKTTIEKFKKDTITKPTWVTSNNLRKIDSAETQTFSSRKKESEKPKPRNVSPSKIVTKPLDDITSGYGVGPVDTDGKPLFGIRALRNGSSKYQVKGTVVREEYHSTNGSAPEGEISVTAYSTNPKDLERILSEQKLGQSEIRKSSFHGLSAITSVKKIKGQDSKAERKAIEDVKESKSKEVKESTSEKKYERQSSVKSLTEKLIKNAVETSKTERSTYPKAGLILRSSSIKDQDDADLGQGDHVSETTVTYETGPGMESKTTTKKEVHKTHKSDNTSEYTSQTTTQTSHKTSQSVIRDSSRFNDDTSRINDATSRVSSRLSDDSYRIRDVTSRASGVSSRMSESPTRAKDVTSRTSGVSNRLSESPTRSKDVTNRAGVESSRNRETMSRASVETTRAKDASSRASVDTKSDYRGSSRLSNASQELRDMSRDSSQSSFLDSRTKVTGVKDILTRMKNADIVIETTDTVEDAEARSLLNKFLGATVLMAGMKNYVVDSPTSQYSTTSSRKTESKIIEIKDHLEEDLETIWDEKLLYTLLENSTDYERRRQIRARIRQLMAEKEACEAVAAAVTGTSDEQSDAGSNGAVSREEMTSVKSSSIQRDSTEKSVTEKTTKTTKVSESMNRSSPKTISPFSKFKQLEKQNSTSNPSSPKSPTVGKPLFKFTDPALAASAATIKDRLLQWCRDKTRDYENVKLENFSTSWSDGLAFCALIHHFLPDAFDYSELTAEKRRHNFTLAFRIADEKAGIYPLLDVDDMVAMRKPDWKCVFTYVQAIHRRFKDN